ncbi:MAG TPA: hypothetical protein VGQ32_03250, partial [Thermoanaerobaculia bacterium]|nr:hypothetical protein [Thermoanaerobaculia bacterium]
TGNNSIPVLGLVLRYSTQGYYAFYRLGGGSSVLRISVFANGQETVLAQGSVSNPSENVFFRLSASAQGSALSLTLEGVKTITATDIRITSGAAGILMATRTSNAALRLSHRADDFSADVATATSEPRLAVSLTSDPAPQTLAPGTADAAFANVALDTAGSSEDVSVFSIQLDLETDIGATAPQACRLFDGPAVLTTGGNIVNPGNDGTYPFTLDGPLSIPAGTTRTLTLRCDVPSSATPGDTMEWRLRAADAVSAHGASSGQDAVVSIQESADNQNRVTVQSSGGGSGAIDLRGLRGVLRASEMALGNDVGEQKPPLLPHFALNFDGPSPPATAWLAVSDLAAYGDVTVCADHLDSEINGEQCGGVAALVTEGSGGRAIVARSCDAKGTDTLRMGVLDTTTGVVTALVNVSLMSRIDTYGGTNPPANCDHHQNQLDYHMYCQWIRTCLTVKTNANGTVTFTATSWLRGSGLKNDPSRNEPESESLTLIGTATWTGPRPAGVAATGKIGLVGTATQGREVISLTNFRVEN